MKLISFNVNGFRACLKKGFNDFYIEEDADIYCLQETKMKQEQSEFDTRGYFEYWNSAQKAGYSGTAIFTKIKPLSVSYGMEIEEHDQEGRVINLEFDDFYLVNCYTPNSQRELTRLDYRMKWEDDFLAHLNKLKEKKGVVLCGDLNVAHKEIDLKNPSSNKNNAGFTDKERDKFSSLLDSGYIDTFRHLFPDKKDAYSWWSYMAKSRERNIGWRIDYFVVSNNLEDKIKNAFILPNVLGSDHCPVGLELKD